MKNSLGELWNYARNTTIGYCKLELGYLKISIQKSLLSNPSATTSAIHIAERLLRDREHRQLFGT